MEAQSSVFGHEVKVSWLCVAMNIFQVSRHEVQIDFTTLPTEPTVYETALHLISSHVVIQSYKADLYTLNSSHQGQSDKEVVTTKRNIHVYGFITRELVIRRLIYDLQQKASLWVRYDWVDFDINAIRRS